jgi:plasmid maintenance system antidote protein VapI
MTYTLEENVLILFDSGVFKTQIAEMMDIPRKKVVEIVDGRSD